MSRYQLALATRESPQSRVVDAVAGFRDIEDGIMGYTRHNWRELYHRRHHPRERIRTHVSGPISTLENFVVDIAHILLIVGGLMLLVRAIMNL